MKKVLSQVVVGLVMSLSSVCVLADAAVFPVGSAGAPPQCQPEPSTPSYYAPNFCADFPKVATCQCAEAAPLGFCTNNPKGYSARTAFNTMIKFQGTIQAGCQFAISHGIIPASDLEDCIDRWSCFDKGGSYDGHLCNGNGQACPTNS